MGALRTSSSHVAVIGNAGIPAGNLPCFTSINLALDLSPVGVSHYGLPLSWRDRDMKVASPGRIGYVHLSALGQVMSGRWYWADGSLLAGQQFESGHDDIGVTLSGQTTLLTGEGMRENRQPGSEEEVAVTSPSFPLSSKMRPPSVVFNK